MEEYLSTDIYVSKRNNSLINGKMIGRVLGVLLFIEAGMFVLCSGISVVYGESDYKYFLYTAGINLLSGALLMFYGRGAENRLSRRDGYCIVTLSWVFFTLFGMLPFYSRPCRDLLLRELRFLMISNRFRMVCFSGAA